MSPIAARFRALLDNRLLRVIAAVSLLGGVFTAGIVWSSLDHVEQRRSYRSAIGEAARLLGENAKLEAENEKLKSQIAKFERQLQVNQIAYDKLTRQLSESTSYINELREDLDFYRSIISPQDNTAGVKIQELTISRASGAPGYAYRLTVVQALDHDKSVSGEASLHIEGMRDGVPVRLSMIDVGDPPEALSFRYFQVLEGRFALPDSFEPVSAVVRVVTSPAGSGKRTEIEQSFEWSVEG